MVTVTSACSRGPRARATTTRGSCSTSTVAICRVSATMRPLRDDDEVDLCIVGAGAGGSVLAQRLARHGWRIVILEAGPFWHPDEDWVSDEAGSHQLYWTQKRIIGGTDPIEMGKNNSGRGVGGSMVHYAGYCPRFHPSDFETQTRDGVGADWPIAYEELRPHYEEVSASCRSPARTGPGAIRTRYPFSPHPVERGRRQSAVAGRRSTRHRDASRAGRHRQRHIRQPAPLHLPRLLPAGLQGEREGEPLRHPPARRARPRRRGARRTAWRSGSRSTRRAAGQGVVYVERRTASHGCSGRDWSPSAGYSIETPRLLLNSTSAVPKRTVQQRGPGRSLRHGAGRDADRGPFPDRTADVQGAAARGVLRGLLRDRLARAALPGVSPSRPSRRCRSDGPSTCSPTGIGDGRCASTCATTTTGRRSASSTSCFRRPDNRVTLAERDGQYGLPIARFDYTPVRERPAPTWPTRPRSSRHPAGRRCAGHAHHPPLRPPHRWRRMGPPGEQRGRRRPAEAGRCPTCSSPTDRLPHAGQRQPGADHHGAGLPAGRPLADGGGMKGLGRALLAGLAGTLTESLVRPARGSNARALRRRRPSCNGGPAVRALA